MIFNNYDVIFIIDGSWSWILFAILFMLFVYITSIKHDKNLSTPKVSNCSNDSNGFNVSAYIYNEIESLSSISIFIFYHSIIFFFIQSAASSFVAYPYAPDLPRVISWFVELLFQFLAILLIIMGYGHQLQFVRKKNLISPFLIELNCFNECPFMYDINKFDDKYWDEMTKARMQRGNTSHRSTFDLPNLGIRAGVRISEDLELQHNNNKIPPINTSLPREALQRVNTSSNHNTNTNTTPNRRHHSTMFSTESETRKNGMEFERVPTDTFTCTPSTRSKFQTHIQNSIVVNDFVMEDVVHDMAGNKLTEDDEHSGSTTIERYKKVSAHWIPENGEDMKEVTPNYVVQLIQLHSGDSKSDRDGDDSDTSTSSSESDVKDDKNGDGTDDICMSKGDGDDGRGFVADGKRLPGIDENGENDTDEESGSDVGDGGRYEAHLRYTRKLSDTKERLNNELLSTEVNIPIEEEDNMEEDEHSSPELVPIKQCAE